MTEKKTQPAQNPEEKEVFSSVVAGLAVLPGERVTLAYKAESPSRAMQALKAALEEGKTLFMALKQDNLTDNIGTEVRVLQMTDRLVHIEGLRRVRAQIYKTPSGATAEMQGWDLEGLSTDGSAGILNEELANDILEVVFAHALTKTQNAAEEKAEHDGRLARLKAAAPDQWAGILIEAMPDKILTQEDRMDLLSARTLTAQLRQLSHVCDAVLGPQPGPETTVDETLGEEADEREMDSRLKKAPLPPIVRKIVEAEFKKLQKLPKGQSEAAAVSKWIDEALSLPWGKMTPSLTREGYWDAWAALGESHFGLEEVKKQINGILAVEVKTGGAGRNKGILLVGPPGVGKTSIAETIARAMGRAYVREALGGVHDEAAIRGHRKTYVAAMAGKIAQGLKTAGTMNPVFVLDEIDKLGESRGGDPAAALLEALDPKQNSGFKDAYFDFPLDLSKVFFVATANDLFAVPEPLRNRFEVIELRGYTPEEKAEIARRHLVDKIAAANGFDTTGVDLLTPGALLRIATDYTGDAGMREMDTRINQIARATAIGDVEGDPVSSPVTTGALEAYLGRPRRQAERLSGDPVVGQVNGLYWSRAGGGVMRIQAASEKTGRLQDMFNVVATGNLGKVMGESVEVARSLVAVRGISWGLKKEERDGLRVHVHALDAAVSKDGPSAGAAMTLLLYSVLKNQPVRGDVALTGEISLHGTVEPIGGVPEKLGGAIRAGARTVLLPEENIRDVPKELQGKIEIIAVRTIEDVLHHALVEGHRLFPKQDNTPASRPVSRRDGLKR